jgi:hypothetical protein
LFLLVIAFPPIFADDDTGSLEVTVLDINDDLINTWGLSVEIYQNNSENPYLELNPPTNPFVIDSLPLGHTYVIDVFRHDMFGGFSKVKMNDPTQQTTTKIYNLAGIEFEILYSDNSPISGALVEVFSHDGIKWGETITDNRGKSERLWLQQTAKQTEEYYSVKISLNDDFVHSIEKITLNNGLNDVAVVTTWNRIVDELVTVKLYHSPTNPVTQYDGKFVVELYDGDLNKMHTSKVDYHGEVYFSNLEMGNYYLNVLNIPEDPSERPILWALKKILIGNDNSFFKIFAFDDDSVESQTKSVSFESPDETCNCVSFRLDNVQDDYLNNVQMKIIELFEQKNQALTIGVIGTNFGNDDVLVNFLKESISNNPQLEIGNQVSDSIITSSNRVEQHALIQDTNKVILDTLGVSPSVLIPPFGVYDDTTISILEEEGMDSVSSTSSLDLPPYPFDGSTHRFPSTTASNVIEIGKFWHGKTANQIIKDIEFSMRDYGYAVVQLNPQEHSNREGWNFDNSVDLKQLYELSILIDKVNEMGLSIVPIGSIPNEVILVSGGTIPDWVKNNAKWWSQNYISDSEYKNSIEYMIDKKIILIVEPESKIYSQSQEIPTWLKTNAGYWSDDKISDREFLDGLTFLIQQGIVILS